MTEPQSTSNRVLGAPAAISIVAGSMLGIGIFLSPRVVAEQLPSPEWFIIAWVFGGLIAFAGASAYAELGTMFPKAGGDYVFLREAFGPSAAFASGWLLFGAIFTGSIATIAVPIMDYQLPVLAEALQFPFDPAATLWGPITHGRALAVLVVLTLTALNVIGTSFSGIAQMLLTLCPIVILSGGAIWIVATAPHETAIAASTAIGDDDILYRFSQATLAVYFAYSGWNAVGYVGGEVKNPDRNIPLGLIGGTLLITGLYILLCYAFLVMLGIGGLQSSPEAGSATAFAFGGSGLKFAMTGLIALALLGSLNGTILAGARIGFAMANDGALPRALATLHPVWKTPSRALWLQAVLACILIVSGSFVTLLEMTSLSMLVMGCLSVISLYLFRVQHPERVRPHTAIGYPWLPGFYLIVSLLVIGVSVARAFGIAGEMRAQHWYPLVGICMFALGWLGHKLIHPNGTRRSSRR